MSWFKLTDEERAEWRNHPVTQAYFSSLREQIDDARGEVVSAVQDGSEEQTNKARCIAGRVDGFETAIKIMERDA